MTHGLAPCEQLVERHGISDHLRKQSWEVGRLVLAPQFRSGPEVLKRCLYLTLLYLIDTCEVQNLLASCTPLLSRLYRRCGFNVIVKDASQDAQGSYSLIHGDVPAVLRALSGDGAERQRGEAILARRAPAREALPC